MRRLAEDTLSGAMVDHVNHLFVGGHLASGEVVCQSDDVAEFVLRLSDDAKLAIALPRAG
jgi:hypothetical protein